MTTQASQSSTATALRTNWHIRSNLTEEYRIDNREYASTDSGAEREEEPLATTTKLTTTRKCTGTDVVQHLHQSVHADTRSFIYEDDLCIASQGNDFNNINDTNQLRENPSKTKVCAFHLRNREAKRELNVVWNGTRLSNITTPVYMGIQLDQTLCYKTHIEKTKMKVNARNNLIRKFANSKWGFKASTLIPSCLALCYSAAEYACPVWARSTHAHKLNPALHDCCRIISGCLKPTNLDSVHLLSGVALLTPGGLLPAAWNAYDKTTDDRHQLFHHQAAASILKSRKSFMRTVKPLESSASSGRLRLWNDSLADVPASTKLGLELAESFPAGSGEDWLCW